jgi:hypothetical protein
MLKEIHTHIVRELQQSSRTDTVFVVSAILFNLIVLGINWGVASDRGPEGNREPESDIILALLIAAVLAINYLAIKALVSGKDTRKKLLTGLIKMYRDNAVDQYYDAALIGAYGHRYRLFIAVLAILGIIAVVVPLTARLFG